MDMQPDFPENYPLQTLEHSKITGAILRSWAAKLESGELRVLRGTTSLHNDIVEAGDHRFVSGVRLICDLYLVNTGGVNGS
jgi:hypothetical protein